MNYIKEVAPATGSKNDTTNECKDRKRAESFHQNRILKLLSAGGHYSAADISVALHLSDPRSLIRRLRHKGIPILDEWHNAAHGGRFKKYFIKEIL